MRNILVILLVILSINTASAEVDQVIINSADWQDVYSGMLYASLGGVPSKFILSEQHSTIIIPVLDKSLTDVYLIESTSVPYTINYKNRLKDNGYSVTVLKSTDATETNLELAESSGAHNFIIIDKTYGFNAISVAPYAIKSSSFVLFADNENIDRIYSFLKTAGTGQLMLYGYLDREVKETLEEFDPEVINTGSRFDDNLAIVEKYMQIEPVRQVVLTNGEFLEGSIMSGNEPVIFIGKNDVPPQVIEYVKGSDISVGVVVGNELVGSAKRLKDATGITIFVKFAQGYAAGGAAGEVTGLDVFPMPKYDFDLDIISANYNAAMKNLEVTYENKAVIDTYLQSTITIYANERHVTTVGDTGPAFVESDGSVAIAYYPVDLDEYISGSHNLTADITTRFGEAAKSLDHGIRINMAIGIVSEADTSAIEIKKVVYNTRAHKLKVQIQNTADMPVYVKTRVEPVIYGEKKVLTKDDPELIDVGETRDIVFITTLSDTNLEENPEVFVHINFGERQSVMIKVLEGYYPLDIERNYMIYVAAGISFIILVLILRKKFKKSG